MTARSAAALFFSTIALFAAPVASAAPFPTVAFRESAVTVNESAGTVTLHLDRTGDLSLESIVALQVDYPPSDGRVSGFETVVKFAPLQATHDMVLTIADDTLYQGTQIFSTYMYDRFQAEIGSPSRVNVTVVDDDPLTLIGFAQPSYSANEGTGAATISLIRSGATNVSSTITWIVTDSSTQGQSDYSVAPGTVTFAPGESVKTFAIPLVNDTIAEWPEEAFISLGITAGGALVSKRAMLTIVDDDVPARLAFSPSSYTVDEGGGTVTVTITRSANVENTTSVHYSTVPGTASEVDFVSAAGFLSFAPGETTKSVVVPIFDDLTSEDDEVFSMELQPGDRTLVSPPATITIVDNDVPATLTFTPSTYQVAEGAGSVTVTLQRSGALAGTTFATFGFGNGTATATQDYAYTPGTVSFAPGETSKTISIPILDDSEIEGTETFSIVVSAPGSVIAGNATISILDDEPQSQIGFDPASYQIAENGSAATLTLKRTGDTSGTARVNVTEISGSAISGADFYTSPQPLFFGPGETSKKFFVDIINDSAVESDESFTVQLSAPSNATLSTSTATVTIVDDDQAPSTASSIGFDPVVYTVSESGGTIALTVRRTGATTASSVAFTTVSESASAGTDFVATSGTLTFAAGETVKTIVVTILNDGAAESSETFGVQLSSPSNATLVQSAARVTISDDDQPATYRFSPSAYEVPEGAGSVTLTVVREGNTAGSSSVEWATCCSWSAAQSGSDYAGATGTLTFAPGEITRTITIAILQDSLSENDEGFAVQLNTFVGSTANVTIRDDEPAPRLSIGDVTVSEGNSGTTEATVTIRLSTAFGQPTTFGFNTANGSATTPVDYGSASSSVRFEAGQTSQTFTIRVQGDTIDEGDEYFTVHVRGSYYAPCCGWNPLEASGTVTIRNDDASFSVSDPIVTEGDGGVANAKFVVRLSVPLSSPASVSYTTLAGSAQFDSDFTGVSGALTFAPGETSKEVLVPVIGDRVAEPNETFFLRISDAIGAPISRAQGKATIVNDDAFYVEYDGLEYAGAGKHALALDLLVPTAESATPRPLVVWVHGDHWTDGSRAASPAIREADRGYVVASIDYRSSDAAAFPAQIDDVKAAVRWLRANAARYHIDAERVAVWGFGSGGHLAALLGTSGGVASLEDLSEGNAAFSSRVQLVIDWAGPIDLLQLQNDSLACSTTNHDSAGSYESLLIGCSVQRCPERAGAASPSSYVTADDPPFLLMHGRADCEVGPAQSESFARLLRAAQLEVALKVYDNVGHTGSFWDTQEALATVDAFLDSHFKSAPRRRATEH
jgi:acetyl esterase/lipase